MKTLSILIITVLLTCMCIKSSDCKKENNNDLKKVQSDMINNYYTGPNYKEINQQLAQIKQDIWSLKVNITDELSSEMRQLLAEIKGDIRELKENFTSGSSLNGLCSEVKRQVAGVREEVKVLRQNLTGGPAGNGLLPEMKQLLAELKEEIMALKGNQTGSQVRKNCADVFKSGDKISGVYKIDPDGLGEFEVFCDQATAGGGWTVFQKRQNGSVGFFRPWDDYKRGFGNLKGEFWLGLDKIHRLTVTSRNKLRVDLEDRYGSTAFAEYSSFSVASERVKYQLSLGSYSGTAGDSLGYHRAQAFTTKDRDNDKSGSNCALSFKGAWWYNACHYSNLNGLYLNGQSSASGMSWRTWKGYYSVKRSEMKIRPKDF